MNHSLRQGLHRLKSAAVAKTSAGFFKTGKGEYSEGDRFLGVKVPELRRYIRQQATEIDGLSLASLNFFLQSPWHEERLFAVLILVRRYEKASRAEKRSVLKFYLKMAEKGFINNWDLVDSSAPNIPGDWILNEDRERLDSWVVSKSLWKRRIAIVATWTLIRNQEFQKTVEYVERLLLDSEDLIHKACGWMLREMGKRDAGALRRFLTQHYLRMPRTMLRYAIERFPEKERKRYLKSLIKIKMPKPTRSGRL